MAVQLPLFPSIPDYTVSTTLSNVQYNLRVRWNERDGAWYIDVSTEENVLIRGGIKVVLGALLGGRVVDDAFPQGVLQAVDQSNTGIDAGFADLGDRVQIYYYAFTEFPSE